MDFTAEELARGLREVYVGDVQAMVRAYYERVQMMVKQDPPDIIGHLDLIKKLNKGNRFFDAEVAKLLLNIGYHEVKIYLDNKWTQIKLATEGLQLEKKC